MGLLDILTEWSRDVVYRTHYGQEEPTHLPKDDYFYDDFVWFEWMESDESLRRRIMKKLEDK